MSLLFAWAEASKVAGGLGVRVANGRMAREDIVAGFYHKGEFSWGSGSASHSRLIVIQ